MINFYNFNHNGDIHVSRTFIKDIIKKIPYERYTYYHFNSNRLLLDLPIHIFDIYKTPNSNITTSTIHTTHFFKNEDIFINTWYVSNNDNFIKYGCTLQSLYENFKIVYKDLKIEIEDIEYYIPDINFEKYYIQNIKNYFENCKFNKKIYISNGYVLSGQANNYNMDYIIDDLSTKFKDYLFIISNNTKIKKDNIIESKEIIQLNDNDLNENAYLSTYCDVIFGRLSGTHSFSINKANFITENKQIFVVDTSLKEYDFGISNFIHKNKTILKIDNNITDNLESIIKNI